MNTCKVKTQKIGDRFAAVCRELFSPEQEIVYCQDPETAIKQLIGRKDKPMSDFQKTQLASKIIRICLMDKLDFGEMIAVLQGQNDTEKKDLAMVHIEELIVREKLTAQEVREVEAQAVEMITQLE